MEQDFENFNGKTIWGKTIKMVLPKIVLPNLNYFPSFFSNLQIITGLCAGSNEARS